MAATAVVLQHLHLHYITVATYHHYSLFHHPKEGQPPAYRKQQTGNTDPHYPAARPEPPQRTTDGRNRTAMATNNLNSIRQLTVQSLLSREDENTFRRSFATIHPSYLPKLRESYPQLTRNEELLAMLICMNQSTDEIALIMGINRNSVNVVRSRMRKNIELPKEKSLDEVLKQYPT